MESAVGVAVPRWDTERTRKIQVAVQYLVKNNVLERGHQSRLAEYFDVSRQRVNQVVLEEKKRLHSEMLHARPSAAQIQ